MSLLYWPDFWGSLQDKKRIAELLFLRYCKKSSSLIPVSLYDHYTN